MRRLSKDAMTPSSNLSRGLMEAHRYGPQDTFWADLDEKMRDVLDLIQDAPPLDEEDRRLLDLVKKAANAVIDRATKTFFHPITGIIGRFRKILDMIALERGLYRKYLGDVAPDEVRKAEALFRSAQAAARRNDWVKAIRLTERVVDMQVDMIKANMHRKPEYRDELDTLLLSNEGASDIYNSMADQLEAATAAMA